MSIAYIDEYIQKDGKHVLDITMTLQRDMPKYMLFFADAEDIDLVKEYDWYMNGDAANWYPVCDTYCKGEYVKVEFRQMVLMKRLGFMPDCVGHYNGMMLDNCFSNLFVSTPEYNKRNDIHMGYNILYMYRDNKITPVYEPYCILDNKYYYSEPRYYLSELEACKAVYVLEQKYYSDFNFNFFLHRFSGGIDLLIEERRGEITSEEAVRAYIERHNDAWHYYRYNLMYYYFENDIPMPKYYINSIGKMADEDGETLCPYDYIN